MNLNLLTVTLIGAGGILIFSAVKGYDPRDVVKGALQGKSPSVAAPVVYDLNPTSDTIPSTPGV